jgi:hypothetical protein
MEVGFWRPSASVRTMEWVPLDWRLLRTDPVLGTTRADLNALRDYMTNSVETTLISLAKWIAEERRTPDTPGTRGAALGRRTIKAWERESNTIQPNTPGRSIKYSSRRAISRACRS